MFNVFVTKDNLGAIIGGSKSYMPYASFCNETFLDVSPVGSVLAWRTSFHGKCLISEDVSLVGSALAGWMLDGWVDDGWMMDG